MQLYITKFRKSFILSTKKWIKYFPWKNSVKSRGKSGDITSPSGLRRSGPRRAIVKRGRAPLVWPSRFWSRGVCVKRGRAPQVWPSTSVCPARASPTGLALDSATSVCPAWASPSGLALKECLSSVHAALKSGPWRFFVKRGRARAPQAQIWTV